MIASLYSKYLLLLRIPKMAKWGQRGVIALAVLLAIAVIPIYTFKISISHGYSDFDVYYRTAKRVANQDWTSIYSIQANGNCPYRYAPSTLPLLRPLAAFDAKQARLLWFALQFACFAMGFGLLYHIISGITRRPLLVCSLSFLFVLRFCLDCFMIGQITGLMFLFLCLALISSLEQKPLRAGACLAVPALLKIGPIFSYVFFHTQKNTTDTNSEKKAKITINCKTILGMASCVLLLFLFGLLCDLLWNGSTSSTLLLWKDWLAMLRADSSFFDSSHYGSQSINSALLRLSRAGWISPLAAALLHKTLAVLGCLGILILWGRRVPKTARAKGLFYSLGIFAFLWFMPFTFKYSLPLLAIPVSMILSGPMHKLEWFAFVFGALVLSLGGLDIVGDRIFFALQKSSIPLLATFLLAAAVIRQSIQESKAVSRTS